jgi:hypothetical protein
MMPSFRQLMAMVGRSLQAPREGAAEILSLGVPREAIWLIICLVVLLSVILAEITAMVSAGVAAESVLGIFGSPIAMGLLQLAVLLLTIGAIYSVGRALGGTGSLEETAVLISWLQFIMVCIQVVQTAAFVVMPPLGGMIGVAALILFLWVLTNFVAALHGFRSLWQVFGMIVVSTFTIAFVLTLVLTMLGVGFEMPAGEV